jgi:ABC-type uncharacterized transport system involved in gliding motility auxiliary subunit
MEMRKSWFKNPALYYVAGLVVLFLTAAVYLINQQIDAVITVGIAITLILLITAVLIDPERVRGWLTGRQARYGSNVAIMSVAFIGILAVINFLAYSNPKQWDLTEDQAYSLAPETEDVLEELPDHIEIIGFYTPSSSNSRDNIRPLLDQYVIRSERKIYYYFIDPQENPFLADRYGVTRDGSLVVVNGDRSEVIEFASEEQITEALVRMLNPGNDKVYFLTGHAERDFESIEEFGFNQVRSTLESKNYETESLNLFLTPTVPDDASLILIAAPQARLAEAEVEALKGYFNSGGVLIYLSEPGLNQDGELDFLEEFLATEFGTELRQDFVVDLSSSLPLSGISAQYAVHPITDDIQNLVTFYPSVRSISLDTPENISVNQTQLVLTGENSWGETDLTAFTEQGELEFNEELDIPGPLVLAVIVEDASNSGRAIIFGDSDFASNGFFFEFGNGDILINSIDWAVGNEELINLTPKPSTQRFIVPPSDQTIGLIFLVTVVLMPGAVVLMGTSIWWQRRKRM